MRILIVEDEPVTRAMLKKSLEKWDYDVISTTNIKSAETIVVTEKIQLVITDLNMPGGNGDELCQRVRALKLPFYTYMILVTSLENDAYPVLRMKAGADDFIQKPFNLDEVQARIRAGERILDLEKELQEKNESLVEVRNKLLAADEIINRDIDMAAAMQYSLLPSLSSTNQGITIAWRFHPSTQLSGDIFNFFPLDEHHVGFYILDVAGHGIASAMQSFTLSRILSPDTRYNNPLSSNSPMLADRRTAKMTVSASAVVTSLNQQFQTDTDNILYFTIIYGVIDTQDCTIDLCQAGHPHALYLKQGKPTEFIANSNLPVGIMPDPCYESVSLKYDSGDRLFLYSDGITECESPTGEMFGVERLRLFMEETRHLKISEVIQCLDERIRSWHSVKGFEDDISMLLLEL